MKIWRGDHDPQKIRKIHQFTPTCGGLLTNLVNGGNSLALSQQPFIKLIEQHVIGWDKTHFLSFSKDPQIAEKFAIGRSGKTLVKSQIHQTWDALVIEADTSKLAHVRNCGVGIDIYKYNSLTSNHQLFPHTNPLHPKQCPTPHPLDFKQPLIEEIAVIDICAYLSGQQGQSINRTVIKNSQQDQEVLILPIRIISDLQHPSGVIDMGLLSAVNAYELI